MSLTVQSISYDYNEHSLLTNISFELGAGQWLFVKGANGSGKTTLLKLLTGFKSPHQGQILWQGTPIQQQLSHYQQKIAWLGHTNGLKAELTALENLRFNPAMQSTASIQNTLKRVGLKAQQHHRVSTFSAGMKRRLALARLCLSAAPLWILDEPQTALDQAGTQLLVELLTEHLQQQGSVILSSHLPLKLVGFEPHYLELSECEG
ncbi:MAG: heme ABC exporter ATP-binding protein CcmA [Thiofilum sp.]|uniref:heme ABC exporter ATP-binding protein CcmA n=1 Tax=Thiofilum sp. TaxID=2212733 RepID=UPI0025F34E73|nr:heme ABC exporter ATP-binding protein CcmA [Thiofilum sp.]MBK8453260.1 heme ABC exporter ATP-binding protein CcmA [Thiofilum sp.]